MSSCQKIICSSDLRNSSPQPSQDACKIWYSSEIVGSSIEAMFAASKLRCDAITILGSANHGQQAFLISCLLVSSIAMKQSGLMI